MNSRTAIQPLVRDYMTVGVISIEPQTPLSEAQRLLDSHSISAVPVIDRDGSLAGIVSIRDLLRHACAEMDAGAAEIRVASDVGRRAKDVMRKNVLTVEEDAPLADAAAAMLEQHLHRLIVTRQGVPVGVLSTRDAMRRIVERGDSRALSTIMTSPVATIDVGTPGIEAVRRLDDANVRGLVVVDGDWPIGVFTHTEALGVAKLPRALQAMPVEGVMSYETICLDASTPAFRVASYARQLGVRRILAVSRRDLMGIATGVDLLRLLVAGAP